MKTKTMLIILIVVVAMLIVACGGKKSAPPPGPRQAFAPSWYEVHDNPEFIYTFGNANQANRTTAERAAESNAQMLAAQVIETHVATMTRNFISEAGIDNPEILGLVETATRATANTRFQGAVFNERSVFAPGQIPEHPDRWVAFVRYAIPRDAVNRDFMNRVRNEEALYNRFRASQAFEEMDRVLGN